jgi:peptide/nickel transport system permease protein
MAETLRESPTPAAVRPASTRRPLQRGSRWRPLLRPLALYVPTALAVVTLVFALPRGMPGDPLSARVDPDNAFFVADPETRARFLEYYGLDRPLPAQYLDYLGSIVRGDFGWSITRNAPVGELVLARLPWTLLLVGTALFASSILSYLAGVAAAWRRGSRRDRTLLTAMSGARAIPEYAAATLLLIAFAVVVPAFPLAGAETPFAEHGSVFAHALDVAHHLVLPATALTIGLLAGKFLLVRNTMISALGEDYMVLARAKGLPERLLKHRHGGRNALLPFLTALGIQTGFAVGGAVFVEAVFAYPGMGTLLLQALNERDYPVLEACFLVLAGTVLLANLAVDLAYVRLDPRTRAA